MKYQQDLQIRLRERYRRIYKAGYSAFPQEIQYFIHFIASVSVLQAITDRIHDSTPDLDPETWVSDHFGQFDFKWPDTELARAKVAWHLIQHQMDAENALNLSASFSTDDDLGNNMRDLTEAVIEPFVDYLEEQLGTSSDILYLLERYKRRLEWFDSERLFTQYTSDTSRGEKTYDTHLRMFLFDQGIDYPFSQPASASGLADVIASVESEDPLVCEVKLFDNDRYTKSYVAKGLRQALEYAQDYGKTAAYLVVFNLSERQLQFPTDDSPSIWPPRFNVGGVTVYLVPIRARPLPPASRRGKLSPINFARDDLIDSDA